MRIAVCGAGDSRRVRSADRMERETRKRTGADDGSRSRWRAGSAGGWAQGSNASPARGRTLASPLRHSCWDTS
eukprot:CAMPEP_0172185960 /NCGR_PEP_ID=MMETSP1050-20130122/20464_1 /TAXON_ID=233186 /ORGANISM="Cryptomonas curvata, Strain CCAP979/52" /LENGTH=72 /DNA_ID=CAMNT_0012860013 /DNA_START=68 /DNA_END=282 /DNA_ORIENTATION=+